MGQTMVDLQLAGTAPEGREQLSYVMKALVMEGQTQSINFQRNRELGSAGDQLGFLAIQAW